MNKDLILSFKKYSKIKHKRPYFYSIEFKPTKQILYYFGAEHKKDLNHPQFELLQKKWQEFVQKNQESGVKIISFFEWNIPKNYQSTLEESVKKYGEAGAILFLSNKAGFPSIRVEPTIEYEAGELLKEFSKEEIFYFYISRMIGSRKRMSMKQDLEKTIKLGIERYSSLLSTLWKDFDFSFKSFKKIHRHYFNKDLQKDDEDFFAEITSPMLNNSKFNEIARKSSTIRNIFILNHIEEFWQKGYSIFVVYGASHAVMQEDAIKSLV